MWISESLIKIVIHLQPTAYMAVAGAPIPIVDHAQVMAEFALEVMDAIDELAAELGFAHYYQ